MVEASRYNVSDDAAHISNGVLKNKLGIINQAELEDTETILLADTYQHFFDVVSKVEKNFNSEFITEIHLYFFEPLYTWAGELRTVDISKDNVLFASVRFLSDSMQGLNKVITDNSVDSTDDIDTVAEKLAIIHNEFNAIHPFREGNGRTIRLFLDLLVSSVGYEVIDYGASTKRYIDACKAGMIGDHKPMAEIITTGLKRK